MNLRPYQIAAKEEIRNAYKTGSKRVVLCAPTGLGKTVTFADIARDTVHNGRRVLIVVDRTELLEQSVAKLKAYGLSPSLITAGKHHRPTEASFVATVQTLKNRKLGFNPDLVIIDEAHKQIFDKVFEIPELREAFFIGATATPYRRGRMTPLSKNYARMVEPTSIDELIAEGFLVPARTFGPADVDLSAVKRKGYEFDAEAAFAVYDKKPLYDGVVDKFLKHTPNTKALCFCINVAHSEHTAAVFRERGINAEHVDGSTPGAERKRIINAFKRGRIQVLTNCDILTTGFDDPTIETVIVNRPTDSLPLWLQMCGRGSRPAPGKTNFFILDMGGNVARLGHWEQPREWKLHHTTSERVGVAPIKECPECEQLIPASRMVCACGYEFPREARKLVETEFKEIESPIKMPSAPLEIFGLDDLLRYQSERGYKMGWVIMQIKTRSSVFPRPLDSLDALRIKKGYSRGWFNQMIKIYFPNFQAVI